MIFMPLNAPPGDEHSMYFHNRHTDGWTFNTMIFAPLGKE